MLQIKVLNKVFSFGKDYFIENTKYVFKISVKNLFKIGSKYEKESKYSALVYDLYSQGNLSMVANLHIGVIQIKLIWISRGDKYPL